MTITVTDLFCGAGGSALGAHAFPGVRVVMFARARIDGPDWATAPNPLRPWHHRMLDLSSYAAGALGLDVLPGLASVCEQLGVDPPDHTAEADVRATVLCVTKISHLSATTARSRALLQF